MKLTTFNWSKASNQFYSEAFWIYKDSEDITVLYGAMTMYTICNKNDAKKPEMSSTSYRENLLVCVIQIERLKMLFSHLGVLYLAVLLRRRKISATRQEIFFYLGDNGSNLVILIGPNQMLYHFYYNPFFRVIHTQVSQFL